MCLPPAEYEDLGTGNAASLTACNCGHIATFDVGFITVGASQYIATVGFSCSSGQQKADPGAAGLTLTSTLTTGQCNAGGCGSIVADTVQVSSLLGVVGLQGAGAAVWLMSRSPAAAPAKNATLQHPVHSAGLAHSPDIVCRPVGDSADRELHLWQRHLVGRHRPLEQLDCAANCRTPGSGGLRPATGVRSSSSAAQPAFSKTATAPFARVSKFKFPHGEAVCWACVGGSAVHSQELLSA